MTEPDFETILELCLERIAGGEAAEQCLRDYPARAERLRPYLEVAALLARQPPGQPTRAADGRVRAFLEVGERSQSTLAPGPFSSSLGIVSGPGLASQPGLLVLAAALLGLLLAGALLGQRWSGAGQAEMVCGSQGGIWLAALEWCVGGEDGAAKAIFTVDGTTRLDCYQPPGRSFSGRERGPVYLCRAGLERQQLVALFLLVPGSWSFATATWELSSAEPSAPSGRLRVTALRLANGGSCERAESEQVVEGARLRFRCAPSGRLLGDWRVGPGGRLEASSLVVEQAGQRMAVRDPLWLPVETLTATRE